MAHHHPEGHHHGHHHHDHQAHGQDSHEDHHHGPFPYFKKGIPFRPNYRILIFMALALALLFLYRRVVLIVILLVAVMIWDYLLHYVHFPVHIDPMPFASFFVSSEYGLPIAIMFILIGEILPEMLVGHFEIADFFNFVPLLVLNAVFFSSRPDNFIGTALIALVIYTLVNVAIAFFSGSEPIKFTVEPVIDILINGALIIRLAPLFFIIAGHPL